MAAFRRPREVRCRAGTGPPDEGGTEMGTLTVWKFDSAAGAENALHLLSRLQKEQLIRINDAAYVTWPTDRKKPKTKELGKLTGAGALGGSFWGFLFGLIFF